jgi:DNA-binding cell septation regulator SpoVG
MKNISQDIKDNIEMKIYRSLHENKLNQTFRKQEVFLFRNFRDIVRPISENLSLNIQTI